MSSITIPGLPGTLSIAELSLALIAAAFVIAVAALVPVLVQVRRTALRAERLLTSVDGQLPGLIQDVRALIFKLDRTTDPVRDLAKSLERFEKFINTAVDTMEKTRDTARQMTRDYILPSMANAAGVLALIREGAELIRPRRERGRGQ
ncbi:MAG TPA: hypothetical protein VFW01_09760 [bacterium]|nr:hypothetical protein [bacterium]